MTSREFLHEALGALAAHRLRTVLSSIGIVFGIATVVTAFAIAEGARREAIDELSALGVENVFVRAVAPAPPADARRRPAAPALSIPDMRAIEAATPGVAATAAIRVASVEMTSDVNHARAPLAGVTTGWREIADVSIARGRWLSERDAAERRRVAVVGDALARQLFGEADALGRRVRAAGAWHTVIGVLHAPATSPKRGSLQRLEPAAALLVPLSVMDVSLGTGDDLTRVTEIAIRFNDVREVEGASRSMDAILKRRHIAGTWELVVPHALLEARLRAQRTFNVVLLAIGGLALVISGIGIMNIMLASVAERTHEIGVRRAFGARRREIVRQFALEAAILCTAGGIAGVPLGILAAALVAALGGWPVTVTLASVALALVLAAGVGMVFGIYPAKAAAALDPAAALRAE